jgi:hypothetical protein
MNKSCAKSRYDRPLFTFLFASIGPIECDSLENIGVHGIQLLHISKHLKKTNETFDDARLMLTMTRVALECRHTVELARISWHLIDENTYKDVRKRGT